MFGRVRASSSPAESLERLPSKIIKHDSLSIYEATLMKLKLGSRRDLIVPFEEAMDVESNSGVTNVSSSAESMNMESISTSTNVVKSDAEATTIDANCSCASQSTGDSEQHQSKNVSILYLFSKYNSSCHALTASYREEPMPIASYHSASASPGSSDCHSVGSTKEQSEHQCFSSSSVCPM